MSAAWQTERCECADKRCPVCKGDCVNAWDTTLFRADMQDATGTRFCAGCGDDAFESGLFDGDPDYGE